MKQINLIYPTHPIQQHHHGGHLQKVSPMVPFLSPPRTSHWQSDHLENYRPPIPVNIQDSPFQIPRTQAAGGSDTTAAIDRLLDKPAFRDIRQNAYDDKAFVFNNGVVSEPEQMRLVRATIESADKFAAVTTFTVRPIDANGQVSNTMHSVLAGLAKKQNDPEFSFVFLYDKTKDFQEMGHKLRDKMVGTKMTGASEISIKPTHTDKPTWPKVLDAYNQQILGEYNRAVQNRRIVGPILGSVEALGRLGKSQLESLLNAQHLSGLPITDLKARVYMVAADSGIAAGHHNKFAINDSGFAATLGASIGNYDKPNWWDSGAVCLSQKLAGSQRDVLLDTLMPRAKHIGLLTCQNGVAGMNGATKPNEVNAARKEINKALQDTSIKQPFSTANGFQLSYKLGSGLYSSGFLNPHESAVPGHQAKVTWIQNQGSDLGSLRAKPIEQALKHMFAEAKLGDTILLRNGSIDDKAIKMVKEALHRGVNIRIMGSYSNHYYKEKFVGAVEDIFSSKLKNNWPGQFERRITNPSLNLRNAHGVGHIHGPIQDHAKVYALQRRNPSEPSILMTGTHNLDGQSFNRSHENMMFMESKDTHLIRSLFSDVWDQSPQ